MKLRGIDLNEWTLVTKIKAKRIKTPQTSSPFPLIEMTLWTHPIPKESMVVICGELGRIARRLLANDGINCTIHKNMKNYIAINVSWESNVRLS